MTKKFSELGVSGEFVSALEKIKITQPTNIQEKAIPLILENKDIIGESETGTGKTLAFLLPVLEKINPDTRDLQTVILAPTYELVIQIQKQIEELIQLTNSKIVSQPILGKVSVKRQIENLKKYPHILVASTGRLLELIKMKRVKMHNVKTLIIDEADRMFDNDNHKHTSAVIKTTMRDRQLLAFSATITDRAKEKLIEAMKEPELIKAEKNSVFDSDISHFYIQTDARDKIKILRNLAHNIKNMRAIVFINNSEELELFTKKLKFHKLKADCLHGTWSKEDRQRVIREFRSGKLRLLIASDIAARGLDFRGVTHVINIDIPKIPKVYLHRAGRTGRAGKKGTCISISAPFEKGKLKNFEKKLNINIEEMKKFSDKN